MSKVCLFFISILVACNLAFCQTGPKQRRRGKTLRKTSVSELPKGQRELRPTALSVYPAKAKQCGQYFVFYEQHIDKPQRLLFVPTIPSRLINAQGAIPRLQFVVYIDSSRSRPTIEVVDPLPDRTIGPASRVIVRLSQRDYALAQEKAQAYECLPTPASNELALDRPKQ